jgi:hypothetical protein
MGLGAVSENAFGMGGDTSEPNRSVGFLQGGALSSRAAPRERAPRHDKLEKLVATEAMVEFVEQPEVPARSGPRVRCLALHDSLEGFDLTCWGIAMHLRHLPPQLWHLAHQAQKISSRPIQGKRLPRPLSGT